MKFKLTNNIKDGYREITNFRSEDELKSFTAVHVFRSAEVIVNAKSEDVLLKDIKILYITVSILYKFSHILFHLQ